MPRLPEAGWRSSRASWRDAARAPDGDRLVSERTAFWITDILSDDQARAFAFGRGGSLEFPFPVAAKTGTSQAYRDNWAIGYTRSVTVGVWVGNFDRRPLIGSSGVSGAGPIFHAIMLAAANRAGDDSAAPAAAVPTTARPERAARRSICALSGMPASTLCPVQIDEWMPTDSDGPPCTWHQRAGSSAPGVVVAWPAEYLAWARSSGRAPARPVEIATGATPRSGPRGSEATPLRVVNPPDGATYLIDPTLRREFQTLPLRVAAGRAVIEWRIDGRPVGRAAGDRSLAWPLAVGRHVAAARDGDGREAEVAFLVK